MSDDKIQKVSIENVPDLPEKIGVVRFNSELEEVMAKVLVAWQDIEDVMGAHSRMPDSWVDANRAVRQLRSDVLDQDMLDRESEGEQYIARA